MLAHVGSGIWTLWSLGTLFAKSRRTKHKSQIPGPNSYNWEAKLAAPVKCTEVVLTVCFSLFQGTPRQDLSNGFFYGLPASVLKWYLLFPWVFSEVLPGKISVMAFFRSKTNRIAYLQLVCGADSCSGLLQTRINAAESWLSERLGWKNSCQRAEWNTKLIIEILCCREEGRDPGYLTKPCSCRLKTFQATKVTYRTKGPVR